MQLALTRLSCPSCAAPLQVGRGTTTVACPFCGGVTSLGGQTLVDASVDARHIAARTVDPDVFQRTLLRWLSDGDYTPDDILQRALVHRHSSVLVPLWHVKGTFQCRFSAEAGFDHTVERVVERERKDGRVERRVEHDTRTDWRNFSGEASGRFDVWACATPTIPEPLVAFVEEIGAACNAWLPVEPALLEEQLVEGFARSPTEAMSAPGPAGRLSAVAEAAAVAGVPGDRHRSLRVDTSTRDEDALACLHPFWIATFTYGGGQFPVGVSGRDDARVAGVRPEDLGRKEAVARLRRPWKIALATTIVLGVAGICLGVIPGVAVGIVGAIVTAFLGWRGHTQVEALLERSRAVRREVLGRIEGGMGG